MKTDQKVCLITGASSGIGYAIAKALREDDYKLIVTARRGERLDELQSDSVDILAADLNSHESQDLIEKHIY